jgi:hypothetical protein
VRQFVGFDEHGEPPQPVEVGAARVELGRPKRDPHPCGRRQIPDSSARRREVEIEKGHSFAVPKDDVLGAHVVVADDRPALGICQLAEPVEVGWHPK